MSTADHRPPSHLDLVRLELGELVDGIVGPDATAPFGVYALEGGDPAAELGRHVERRVFGEYFGNSPHLLAAEYGPYEYSSLFLCVVDHRRRVPAGVIRVILPGPAGSKSLHDLETVWGQDLDDVCARSGVMFDPDRIWDVATLAVESDYRGATTNGLVSLALYQALASTSLACAVGWWVTVLDVVVLDLIQTQTQEPFSAFAGVEPMRYLDSPSSVPVWCDIGDWERRLASSDPAMYDVLCRGTGLEEAVAPVDVDAVASLVAPASAHGVRNAR